MAYRTHPPKSRKYKKSETTSKDHKSPSHNHSKIEEHDLPVTEPESKEKKDPQVSGFLSSLFGSNEKTEKPRGFLNSLFGSRDKSERSGSPIFNILNHDIYLDDLLLVGLILLLMTDKIDDEILIIILVYLLIDIF